MVHLLDNKNMNIPDCTCTFNSWINATQALIIQYTSQPHNTGSLLAPPRPGFSQETPTVILSPCTLIHGLCYAEGDCPNVMFPKHTLAVIFAFLSSFSNVTWSIFDDVACRCNVITQRPCYIDYRDLDKCVCRQVAVMCLIIGTGRQTTSNRRRRSSNACDIEKTVTLGGSACSVLLLARCFHHTASSTRSHGLHFTASPLHLHFFVRRTQPMHTAGTPTYFYFPLLFTC